MATHELIYFLTLVCSEENGITQRMVRLEESSDGTIADSWEDKKLNGFSDCFTSADCKLGHYCVDGNCSCVVKHDFRILSCQITGLSVLGCYCATYNEAEKLIEVGKCLYNCLILTFPRQRQSWMSLCVAFTSTGLVHYVVSVQKAFRPPLI